jgi:predicted lipoprotein with Yx(FWY)xxD motif
MRPFNKHILTGGLAAVAAALVLAACGGSSGGSSADNNAVAASSDSGLVSMQSVDGTDVLADSQGKTLYSAAVERSGIKCTAECTSFWRPADASASEAKSTAADLNLTFGTVQRPDGQSQLTFQGLPLYTFTQEGPNQLDGNGFVDEFNGTKFHWQAAMTGANSGSAPSSSSTPSYNSGY